jgi:aromatic ring-cleaving dioxygenase
MVSWAMFNRPQGMSILFHPLDAQQVIVLVQPEGKRKA